MRKRDWALIGVGAFAAIFVQQMGRAHGLELGLWTGGAVVLFLLIATWHRLLHATRTIAEIRRVSAATATTMLKTSERVTEVHREVTEAHHTVAAAGVRLKMMHDQQLAIGAVLRARHPLDGSDLNDWMAEHEPTPDESGEFSGYGRAILKTMAPRALHERPAAFDHHDAIEPGRDEDEPTTLMRRPPRGGEVVSYDDDGDCDDSEPPRSIS